MSPKVVVVGSLSMDFVFQVPRRPNRGETVKGYSFETFVGGKGNNQALAAARAGADCAMIGRVGNDDYGATIIKELKKHSVDTKNLVVDNEVGTGLANIYVDPEGDNSIIIVPRANDRLSVKDIDNSRDLISSSSLVMLQLEIPMETVIYTARLAKSLGKIVMLNPAPAPEDEALPKALLEQVDYFVPNKTEAELVLKRAISGKSEISKALSDLNRSISGESIITLGEDGVCALDRNSKEYFISAFQVNTIDTTAAGDAFCGSFAEGITGGKSLEQSLIQASAAGALATTKKGAAPSLPSKAEIEALVSSKMAPRLD